MKLKPCILDEYTRGDKELGAEFVTAGGSRQLDSYESIDDSLFLEDEHGRIHLKVQEQHGLTVSSLVTGLVVGVEGKQTSIGSGGFFVVNKFYFPELPPQLPLKPTGKDKYVALISGLRFGQAGETELLSTQMMFDYLSGYLGASETDTENLAASIIRVIISGDILGRAPRKRKKEKKQKVVERVAMVQNLKDLDLFFTQLASTCHLDVMPGQSDPSNFSLPQQPLLSSLFPFARKYETFELRSNPSWFNVDGFSILGTSGQNVIDMGKYATVSHPIEFLERTLQWRNIAPTAPDTLSCYPFIKKKPLIINQGPHLFFFLFCWEPTKICY